MTSEPNHDRASEVFLAARKIDGSRREDFLNQACRDDPALRAEVESLLRFDQPTPPFMQAEAIGSKRISESMIAGASTPFGLIPGDGGATGEQTRQIGEYEILDTLGEGGMGIVYLAQASRPSRRVALKVIRSAWVSEQTVKRFSHEAEALARLSHPAIAQLYEARLEGDSGVPPFIAMEYVPGKPLTVYGREPGRSVRERLEMMARICDAVEHAHQRGVIHRDLKPGNILVTPDGEPKVLDFGIARLCDDLEQRRTMHTRPGELVGTLPYMSPEQVDGQSNEIDTRTDVYALGLILYELLVHRPALDLADLPLAKVAQQIREIDPVPIGSLDRRLRGDIETIVAKAIEKDRARRYSYVGELSADIRHYLSDRPILARPASRVYQLRKFARRNRAIVVGVCLAAVAMVGGTTVATWQAVQAGKAARRAEATSTFLRTLFAAIDPYQAGPDVTVEDIARRAEANIESAAAGQPLLESDFRNELGTIYLNLGLLADADRQFELAVGLRRKLLGKANPATLEVKNNLGMLRIKQGRFADAELLLREALANRQSGNDEAATLLTMNILAEAIHGQGRYEEAASLCGAAHAGQVRILGVDHPETLATSVNLASAYRAMGKSAAARDVYHQAIPGLQSTLGRQHPQTLLAMANLARLLKDEKRYGEAVVLQHEVRDGLKIALGADHPDTVIATANLAQMIWRGGNPAESEPLYRDAIIRMQSLFGSDHPNVTTLNTQLALVLESLDQFDEARSLLATALEAYGAQFGTDHPKTRQVVEHLERVTRRSGTDPR